MKTKVSIIALLTSLIFLVNLTGCSKEKQWSEEVKLSDESVVIVKRIAHYRNYSENNIGFGWALKKSEMTLLEPKNLSNATWKSEMAPMRLDYDAQLKTFVVIAFPTDCVGGQGYSLFHLEPAGWTLKKFDSKYVGRKANLTYEEHVTSSYVDLSFKTKNDSSLNLFPAFKEVVAGFSC